MGDTANAKADYHAVLEHSENDSLRNDATQWLKVLEEK
jgi:hypothetical protein